MSYKHGRTAQQPIQYESQLNLINGPPPAYKGASYESVGVRYGSTQEDSRYNPLRWKGRTKIGAAISTVVVLIIIIAVAVTVVRNNRYPDYSPLSYMLVDTFEGTGFFDNFDYFTGYDPSQGFVHYVDGPGSVQRNLTYASSASAVLRVDDTTPATTTGRFSVRVESKKQYNNGLFIFDVVHTPYGCGTWPALWLSDQTNWPNNGEIDVVEAVNSAISGNQMTLHTTDGCSMSVKRKEMGTVLTNNCLNGTDNNAGCGVLGAPDTYGPTLNANGGGIYAMELRSVGIRTWFFPRSNVPNNIKDSAAVPDPSIWGTPLADFPSTDCSIGDHFRNQSIIANIDLCGSWAGAYNAYNQQGNCPGTCIDYVAANPTAFSNAYWKFASFKVYQAQGA